jgi:Fibrinogen beta and gamma chains, C-terminal globular domain
MVMRSSSCSPVETSLDFEITYRMVDCLNPLPVMHAGNSFYYHNNQIFTTHDKGNTSCSVTYRGDWWYGSCHVCNPNAEYNNDNYDMGINWQTWWVYYYSLPYMEMKIKPD